MYLLRLTLVIKCKSSDIPPLQNLTHSILDLINTFSHLADNTELSRSGSGTESPPYNTFSYDYRDFVRYSDSFEKDNAN